MINTFFGTILCLILQVYTARIRIRKIWTGSCQKGPDPTESGYGSGSATLIYTCDVNR
jgi:hypothetical protein